MPSGTSGPRPHCAHKWRVQNRQGIFFFASSDRLSKLRGGSQRAGRRDPGGARLTGGPPRPRSPVRPAGRPPGPVPPRRTPAEGPAFPYLETPRRLRVWPPPARSSGAGGGVVQTGGRGRPRRLCSGPTSRGTSPPRRFRIPIRRTLRSAAETLRSDRCGFATGVLFRFGRVKTGGEYGRPRARGPGMHRVRGASGAVLARGPSFPPDLSPRALPSPPVSTLPKHLRSPEGRTRSLPPSQAGRP